MRKTGLLKSSLAVLLAASMVTGCSGSGKTETTAAPAATEAGKEGTTVAEKGEEVTIRVMVWDRGDAAPGTTSENNAQTDWIKAQVKEKYNINVEYVSVPRSSSDEKVNIMMSGGNAPDIVFTYDQGLFNSFAVNGGLADLTEAYATYGTDIQKYVSEPQGMAVVDGKQLGIMKQRGVEAPRHTQYIRKDWLDALGMEIPKTKAELEAYLTAVKEQNPGNVENVIPWAMSGRNDTEKGYLNFLGSYVDLPDEKTAYIYNEAYMSVAPGAEIGLKKLNEMYNKGLLSKDFATDTTEDIYKAQVTAGNVGFVLDDAVRPWEYISVLNGTVGHETFVPVQCFELADGSYRLPYEFRHAMYIMVPKTSEDKVEACMKYLNWQADPEVAENIVYTIDHERDENGVPLALSQQELADKGYPGTCDDLNIVNLSMAWTSDRDAIVSKWHKEQATEWEDQDWFATYYDTAQLGKFRFPCFPGISQAEADYGQNLKTLMIEYVYKCISCAPEEFDALQKAEYDNLVTAGLQKILDERAAYYDSIQ